MPDRRDRGDGRNCIVVPREDKRTPTLCVDVICESKHGVMLIERLNPPFGWALPGGHVEVGETCYAAAIREVREETGCVVVPELLLGVYSDPQRDVRAHKVSVVYVARLVDESGAAAGSDARAAGWFPFYEYPSVIFDHDRMLQDWWRWKWGGVLPPVTR